MRLRSSLAVSAMFLLCLVSHADTIIDQQSTTATNVTSGNQPFGQSFTPSLSGLNFITVSLFGTGTAHLNLYSGSGFNAFGGGLYAVSDSYNLTNTLTSHTFLFSNLVPFTPGNVFTFQVAGTGDVDILEGNPGGYAGGQEFYGSVQYSNYDLTFAEGITTAATPEPSGLALLGTGVLGVIGVARRRMLS